MPHPRREEDLRPIMLNSAIIQIVDFCVQRRWQGLCFGILLAVVSATYDVRRFSITTDTDSLISQDLPWHQRQSALSKAFPQKERAFKTLGSIPLGRSGRQWRVFSA